MPTKYIGHIVEIVYMDKIGQITQRRIEVKGIKSGLIRAKDIQSGQPRTFKEWRVFQLRR